MKRHLKQSIEAVLNKEQDASLVEIIERLEAFHAPLSFSISHREIIDAVAFYARYCKYEKALPIVKDFLESLTAYRSLTEHCKELKFMADRVAIKVWKHRYKSRAYNERSRELTAEYNDAAAQLRIAEAQYQGAAVKMAQMVSAAGEQQAVDLDGIVQAYHAFIQQRAVPQQQTMRQSQLVLPPELIEVLKQLPYALRAMPGVPQQNTAAAPQANLSIEEQINALPVLSSAQQINAMSTLIGNNPDELVPEQYADDPSFYQTVMSNKPEREKAVRTAVEKLGYAKVAAVFREYRG